jgi:succinate dehydrogenase / fumarate reductase cytochrome b subunit
MNALGSLFRSTIGRKFIMAVTGVVLTIFVVGHLVGNLQVFENPDRINGYAHFLQSLGPTLWFVRAVLLASVALHIWAAVVLSLESWRARGPEAYAVKTWIEATVSSRYMRWTGAVVFAFILYHIAQFTLGTAQSATFKESLPLYTMGSDYRILGLTVVAAGTRVFDVHSMVILGFQNTVVSVFYIVAVGLLAFHLLHGAESLFQTLGWRNARWAKGLRLAVMLGCLAYFMGNLAIPGAVLSGALTPRRGAPIASAESHR